MGQRLVVTVQSEGKDICKIYYHWSAYSLSSLLEVRDLIPALMEEGDTVLNITRFLESRGGGIDNGTQGSEYKAFKDRYPSEEFSNNVDRNEGLIAITEDGMEDLQRWSEGDIFINLDDEMIYNEVLWRCDPDYLDEWEKDMGEEPPITELSQNPFEIPFKDIDVLIGKMSNATHFVSYGGEVYELTE